MAMLISPVIEFLQLGSIREFLGSKGPCITAVLHPHRPGNPAGSRAAGLKAQIQQAGNQFAEWKLPDPLAATLLQPLEKFADDPSLEQGSQWGLAIFRSPDVFQPYHLANEIETSLSIGESFSIRRFLPELSLPRNFYVLALSKQKVSLLHWSDLRPELVKLPEGVPATLEEALALEPPDHDLESRSAAGSSTGAMRRVRFGTGSEREKRHAHLADYYKLVDRGLQKMFGEQSIPLILAGVEEDVAIYRNESANRHLANDNIFGSVNLEQDQDALLRRAYAILRTDEIARRHAELIGAMGRLAPPRFSVHLEEILHAAFEGRVAQLYVDERAERLGKMDLPNYRSRSEEDLLNLALVQTIRHGGKTYELPSDKMPDGLPAVGIMRY